MNILRLFPEQGGEPSNISLDRAVVGRDPACDLHLRDASVSRRHAEIRRNDDEWMVIDLKSANGVLIDGERTSHGVLLPGQTLQFGNVRFRVEIDHGDDGSTLILGRSPLAVKPTASPGPSTGGRLPVAPVARERSNVLLTWILMLGGLMVMAFGLLGVSYYRLSRRAPQVSAPSTPPAPRLSPSAPQPTPIPAASVPEARPTPAPARGTLLISADPGVEVFIDGARSAAIPADGLRRVPVSPGEHIVSFHAGGTRQDQVVRVNAFEQTVVRYSGTLAAASITPSPLPTAPPLPALSTPVPAAAPAVPTRPATTPVATVPAAVTRATPSTPVTPAQEDEGLARGAAADAAGDFYRAVLILKDVAKRLEANPQRRNELARTHAYLAWAYLGLNRPDDARAAADNALKADPSLAVGPDAFPAPVVALFKRTR